MGKAAWPTYTEVGQTLLDAGLVTVAPSEDSLAPHIGAAIEEWERRTGFKPFKQAASASYRYDPPDPDGILDLKAGFTAITAVAAFLTDTDETGTVLTVLTDYELLPYDATTVDRPFTRILFRRSVGSRKRSLKVTGTKGFDDEIPYEAWLAVMQEAAQRYVRDATASGGGATEIKQGPVTIKYSEGSGSVLAQWEKAVEKTAPGYRRTVW